MWKKFTNLEEKFDRQQDKERLEKVRVDVCPADPFILPKGRQSGKKIANILKRERMSIVEKIKAKDITVGYLVKDKMATFVSYRAGVLTYRTTDGFKFPIPIDDTGEASFEKEHKALELMRWIRKQFDIIQKEA